MYSMLSNITIINLSDLTIEDKIQFVNLPFFTTLNMSQVTIGCAANRYPFSIALCLKNCSKFTHVTSRGVTIKGNMQFRNNSPNSLYIAFEGKNVIYGTIQSTSKTHISRTADTEIGNL